MFDHLAGGRSLEALHPLLLAGLQQNRAAQGIGLKRVGFVHLEDRARQAQRIVEHAELRACFDGLALVGLERCCCGRGDWRRRTHHRRANGCRRLAPGEVISLALIRFEHQAGAGIEQEGRRLEVGIDPGNGHRFVIGMILIHPQARDHGNRFVEPETIGGESGEVRGIAGRGHHRGGGGAGLARVGAGAVGRRGQDHVIAGNGLMRGVEQRPADIGARSGVIVQRIERRVGARRQGIGIDGAVGALVGRVDARDQLSCGTSPIWKSALALAISCTPQLFCL